jgi:Protein of unknown function (DUF1553)/Protein of unknown function (DUF1549)
LIGLPPTPAEQHDYLVDTSPDALAHVVDRLLARPEYGERWARHWLDVVRYAESNGYERDGTKPSAWRYRDYVINAFNQDKPYDRFLTEQLAGDELDHTNAETQIATTFLRLGTWDDEPADPVVDRYDQLDDVLGTTATVFLGVTLRCARCHDHKFEPFSQRDYYSMLAVFEPLKRPLQNRDEADCVAGTEAEVAAYHVGLVRAQAFKSFRPKEPPRAYIWYEAGRKAPATHIFHRGDPRRPGKGVHPAVPTALASAPPTLPQPTRKTTGRRLWLARWMTRPENPLVARVMVNRVWQHHFGEGLVPSANDFGVMGQTPSDPELLDWLAADFMAGGWRIKRLQRMIVLSSAYQTARQPRRLEAEAVRDSMLAVSGRLNPAMGGPSVYPPLPRAVLEGQSRPGDGWGTSCARDSERRSVYIFVKRSLAVPELDLLDAPDTTSSCEQRMTSTTGPQALTFLNGELARKQAGYFAERLLREAGSDATAQIRLAFELALCRLPRPAEMDASLGFLTRQRQQIEADARGAKQSRTETEKRALEAFCLAILNLNEFVYQL